MNDAELVNQIKAGNANAFRFLVSGNQRLVMHIVGRTIQQEEDLEDICQEVFIKVFKQINKFRHECKLSTWIATIAYNTSMTYLKKQNKTKAYSIDEGPESALHVPVNHAGSGLEDQEIKMILLELIEKLPIHYRTVLTLFHLEEFSYKEIEQITKIPEGTIKSHLSRARKILREWLLEIQKTEKHPIFTSYE